MLSLLLLLVALHSSFSMKGYIYHNSAAKPSFAAWNENIEINKNLRDGEVLIKVRAASINPVDSKLPYIPIVNLFIRNRIVGQDFSGVVEKSSSLKFKVGDKVFGFSSGTLAEKTVAKDTQISLKPSISTFIEAASFPTVALTSYQALLTAGTTIGSKVCVVGASGGCGLTGIQLARSLVGSLGKVAAICGTQNMDFIKSFNVCDIVADYRTPELLLGKTSPLHTLNGIDILYDTVSSSNSKDTLNGVSYDKALSSFLTTSIRTVAINGSISRWLNALIWKRQENNFNLVLCNKNSKQLQEIAEFVDTKKLKTVIDSVFPFSNQGCNQAYEKLISRRAVGKIVIDIANGYEI